MGRWFNREQMGGGQPARPGRGGRGAASVPARPAPRGLPATVAQKSPANGAPPSAGPPSNYDWRTANIEAPADPPEAIEARRAELLKAMPELRDLLDGIHAPKRVDDSTPVSGTTASLVEPDLHRAPEIDAVPSPEVERDLLLRLGQAGSETVRSHTQPTDRHAFDEHGNVGTVVRQRDQTRDQGVSGGTREPQARSTRAAKPMITTKPKARPKAVEGAVAPSVPAPVVAPVAVWAAEPPPPPTKRADESGRRIEKLTAENQALKSTLAVLEFSMADLERSTQHQLIALEERLITALASADQRQAAVVDALAVVDVEAIETRVLARLQPFDVSTVEQRLGERIDQIDRIDVSALEVRVAERLKAVDPTAIEERIVARLQPQITQSAPDPATSLAALTEIENRLSQRLATEQSAALDERLADHRRSFDPLTIERRVLAAVPSRDDLEALEARLKAAQKSIVAAPVAAAPAVQPPLDTSAIEERIKVRLEERFSPRLAERISLRLEEQIDVRLSETAGQNGRELAALENRIQARLAKIDELAVASQSQLKAVSKPDLSSVHAQIVSVEAKFAAKIEELAVASRSQLEAVSKPDLSSVHAQIVNVEAKFAAKIESFNVEAIQRVNDFEQHIAQRFGENQDALAEMESRVRLRLQQLTKEAIDAESGNVAHRSELEDRLLREVNKLDTRMTARERADDERMASLIKGINEQAAAVRHELATLGELVAQAAESHTKAGVDPAQLDDLEQRITEELATHDKVLEAVEPMRQRIGRLGLEMSSANEEITIMRDHVDKRLAAMDAKADVLAGKVMESSSVDISIYLDRIAEIERAISDLDPDRFALAGDLRSLVQRLDALPGAGSAH